MPPRLPDRLAALADGSGAGLHERVSPLTLVAVVLALLAGLVEYTVATQLFPHHSVNHDEGVYLQQAALLLEGQLYLDPPAGLRDAFRPWFFVESEGGLYSKYGPVPAAIFALGGILGEYRLAPAAIAAATVWLTYRLGSLAGGVAGETGAVDRRVGLLAAAVLAAAPTFLFTGAVFLPYLPTTMLNLAFAVALVRAERAVSDRNAARDDGIRAAMLWALAAGTAAGLAFFARPYTAVLFAAPFLCFALWRVVRAGRRLRRTSGDLASRQGSWATSGSPTEAPGRVVVRYAVTAAAGLALVALTLAYNHALTGSALTFPYEAFAPLDGLGFGHRRILHHEVTYTPELAVRANVRVLTTLATDWFTAGLLGTVAAVAGAGWTLGSAARRLSGRAMRRQRSATALDPATLRLLLLGVVASVVVGNVYFWGNYNILAGIEDPGDGLISAFGPFYHLDLFPVMATFAALAAVRGGAWLHRRVAARTTRRHARVALLVLLALTVPAAGLAQADALAAPLDEHGERTEKVTHAAEPIRTTAFADALVYVPAPYGDWMNHPFQWLRNEPGFARPGFDGPVVYALDRGPDSDLAVREAFPDRELYRYTYRGEWSPAPDATVEPLLVPLETHTAERLDARTRVGVPGQVTGVTAAISNGESTVRYRYAGELGEGTPGSPGDALAMDWTLGPDGAAITDPTFSRTGSHGGASAAGVPILGADEIAVTVTLRTGAGGTFTYRQEVTVETDGEIVTAIWPPERSTCQLPVDCGREGTYLPEHPESRPEGTWLDVSLVDGGRVGG